MPLIKSGQLVQQTALDAESAARIAADAAILAALDQLTQRVNNLSSPTQPVSRDISRFNPLAYSTSNSSSYSYYSSFTMSGLGDGNVNAGMMASSPSPIPGQTEGRIFVHVAMPSARFLNAIDLWCGQFNGLYNLPSRFEIYRDFVIDTSSTPLYTSPLAQVSTQQTFDLTSIAALNTSLTLITIAFVYAAPGSGTVSVNELAFKGYAA